MHFAVLVLPAIGLKKACWSFHPPSPPLPKHVSHQVMDALDMRFPDNSFDLVWACESGEHMPDKKKYVEEMVSRFD
jgi:hypothetical protein